MYSEGDVLSEKGRAAESTVYQSVSTPVCVQHSENVPRIEQRHKKRTFNETGVYKRKRPLLLSLNEAFKKNSKADQIIEGFGVGRFLNTSTSPSGPALL